jgi:hypothetical protein
MRAWTTWGPRIRQNIPTAFQYCDRNGREHAQYRETRDGYKLQLEHKATEF